MKEKNAYSAFYGQCSMLIKRTKTVAVDFDNTIAKWIGKEDATYPYAGPLLSGVKENIQKLKDLGFKVIIWSSRFSSLVRPSKIDRETHAKDLSDFLTKNEIPFDIVDQGECGKQIADYYIDDRNVPFMSWDMMSEWIRQDWEENGSVYK